MISASFSFQQALSSPNRVFKVKCEITRKHPILGTTVVTDLSDRILSYTCSQDFESRNGRLSIEFDNYDFMLSPFNKDSFYNLLGGAYEPLFYANREIKLYEGLVLPDGNVEYVLKFVGYLGDDIESGSSPTLRISCRDKSKLLQDIYIYESPMYSMMLVEDVIQDLLDTFAPHLGISLQVLDPTQYVIGRPNSPYAAKDVNLWDAIQLLADSANQELRFDESGSLFMRKNIRNFSDLEPVMTIDYSSIIGETVSLNDSDVRNHIVVKVQGFNPITKINQDSISRYGRRYMEVQSSMTDIITDIEQAHELAESILADLSYAHPVLNAEIPLHPLIQLGDIVVVNSERTGINEQYQKFKIVNITNNFSPDRKRTTLSLKGYDNFFTTTSAAPNSPTNLRYEIIERRVGNYPGSGWEGYERVMYFPLIKWNPPTMYADGTPLEDNFGGYVIYRAYKNPIDGQKSLYKPIASLPSYMPALNAKVDYFYDYSILSIMTRAVTDKNGNFEVFYRVYAINKHGVKSAPSSELQVLIPYDKALDENGNAIL